MAPKQTGRKQPAKEGHVGSAKERVPFKGYVNVTITQEMKLELKELLERGYNLEERLEDVILDGYRLGVTFDHYHQSFAASLYCQNKDNGNAGWTLAARAGNARAAIVRLLYLHLVHYEGEWGDGSTSGNAADEWT